MSTAAHELADALDAHRSALYWLVTAENEYGFTGLEFLHAMNEIIQAYDCGPDT